MIQRGDLISSAYLAEQRTLHDAPRGYGGKGEKWASVVTMLIGRHAATSVLDYGCGRGTLVAALRPLCDSSVRLSEYDPAIAGKDGPPSFADLVVCTDVLEHVEPEHLDAVLAHLKLLARKAIFAVIALRPSNKTLTDGRNAHLIVESSGWWMLRLASAGFTAMPLLLDERHEIAVVLT